MTGNGAGDGSAAMSPAAVAEQLTTAFKQQQNQIDLERSKLRQLQDDYAYNLRLLEEKDHELRKYEAVYATAKQEALDRDRETSELRIALDEAQLQARCAVEKNAELEQRNRDHIRASATEREQLLRSMDAEKEELRSRHAMEKCDLERQLVTANERLAGLRAELAAEFDTARAKIEAQLREKVVEVERREVCEASRANQLSTELDVLTKRCNGLEDELKIAREQVAAVEMRDLKAEWETREKRHEEATRMAEMAWQLDHERAEMQETVLRLERKVEALCAGIQQQEQALLNREQTVFARELATRNAVHAAQVNVQQLRQKLDDTTYTHQSVVSRLKHEIGRLRSEHELERRHYTQSQSEIRNTLSARDAELQEVKARLNQREADLQKQGSDLGRFKVTLSQALATERQSKEQLKSMKQAWDRWVHEHEENSKADREELKFSMLQERGAIERELVDARRTIQHQRTVLNTVQEEKHDALNLVAEWKRRASRDDTSSVTSMNVPAVVVENERLRTAVKAMRIEMEAVRDAASRHEKIPSANDQSGAGSHVDPLVGRELGGASSHSIRQLLREREQLMDINNFLKSQIHRPQSDENKAAVIDTSSSRSEVQDEDSLAAAPQTSVAGPRFSWSNRPPPSTVLSVGSSVASDSVRDIFRILDVVDSVDASGVDEVGLELQGQPVLPRDRTKPVRMTDRTTESQKAAAIAAPKSKRQQSHPVRHFGRRPDADRDGVT
eukprot:m.292444 g.292444  ORF g.292444 m.292444 type:complete len:732 (+) comp16238_c0_seq3:381-2576(+)